MKLLLTSAGISNTNIQAALVDLLGKPIAEYNALLVWGGDPVYSSYWLRESGLAALLAEPARDVMYVGVSAGSMAASSSFLETYCEPPSGIGHANPSLSEEILFDTPHGKIRRILVKARGAELVDFALIPHFDHEDHPDASPANAEPRAARCPCTRSTIGLP